MTYRLTLKLNYVYKTKHRVFGFMIECKKHWLLIRHVRKTSSNFRKTHGSSIIPFFESLPWILIWHSETLMKAFLGFWSEVEMNHFNGDHGFFFGRRYEKIGHLINMKIAYVQYSFAKINNIHVKFFLLLRIVHDLENYTVVSIWIV